jgi:hypothetical protein
MTDTPSHIQQKQYEIIAAKPLTERVLLGLQSIDATRRWIENSIIQATPNINQTDLAIAVFIKYYQYDFSETEANKIIESIKKYYANK